MAQEASRPDEKQIVADEYNKYGVRMTVFENGDVFVSTERDIHVLNAHCVFGATENSRISIKAKSDTSGGGCWGSCHTCAL